eukprot:3200557-Rhodomonas_salina.1
MTCSSSRPCGKCEVHDDIKSSTQAPSRHEASRQPRTFCSARKSNELQSRTACKYDLARSTPDRGKSAGQDSRGQRGKQDLVVAKPVSTLDIAEDKPGRAYEERDRTQRRRLRFLVVPHSMSVFERVSRSQAVLPLSRSHS